MQALNKIIEFRDNILNHLKDTQKRIEELEIKLKEKKEIYKELILLNEDDSKAKKDIDNIIKNLAIVKSKKEDLKEVEQTFYKNKLVLELKNEVYQDIKNKINTIMEKSKNIELEIYNLFDQAIEKHFQINSNNEEIRELISIYSNLEKNTTRKLDRNFIRGQRVIIKDFKIYEHEKIQEYFSHKIKPDFLKEKLKKIKLEQQKKENFENKKKIEAQEQIKKADEEREKLLNDEKVQKMRN